MLEINGNDYMAGTHLDSVLSDALSLARATREVVKVTFNGQTRRVVNSDNLKRLSTNFFGYRPKKTAEYKRARRKANRALTRKAKSTLSQLPCFLKDWAISPNRFYGKRLSILLAQEVLSIARKYGSYDALKGAVDSDSVVISEDHSGASRSLLFGICKVIFETSEDQWNFKN